MNSINTNDLSQEVERINAAIRSEPLKAIHRLALARLRLLLGDYAKSLQQVQLACQFNAEVVPEAQLIRMLIRAEQLRETVFAGTVMPDLLKPPSPWLEDMIKALRTPGEEGAALRRDALAQAPESAGSYGESSSFSWIADGDERLGPVLEVMFGDSYYWVPFELVASVNIPKPTNAMDLVWTPVELELIDHPRRIAYMPARYPSMAGDTVSESRLTGRETVWSETSEGVWIGQGRRVWYVDGDPVDMFEAGRIALLH